MKWMYWIVVVVSRSILMCAAREPSGPLICDGKEFMFSPTYLTVRWLVTEKIDVHVGRQHGFLISMLSFVAVCF